MSDDNVERTRRAFEAFNARDIDGVLTFFDPSIEFHSAFAAVGGGVYHGHEGMRRWHCEVEETWGDDVRAEPEASFDMGEQTLVFYVLRGHGRQSGVEVAAPVAQVVTWREGVGVLAKVYVDRNAALGDLGVSLDELEPIAP